MKGYKETKAALDDANTRLRAANEAKRKGRWGGRRRRVLTFRRKPKSRSKNGRRPTRKSAVRRNR
jgi:hypothetical protein